MRKKLLRCGKNDWSAVARFILWNSYYGAYIDQKLTPTHYFQKLDSSNPKLWTIREKNCDKNYLLSIMKEKDVKITNPRLTFFSPLFLSFSSPGAKVKLCSTGKKNLFFVLSFWLIVSNFHPCIRKIAISSFKREVANSAKSSEMCKIMCKIDVSSLFWAGVYIILFDPPKNMAKYHVGGKNHWNGMKKRGKMHIFPPVGKKFAYFFPNWLNIYKITKKSLIFRLQRASHHYKKYHLGKKYESRKGGQKYEFQI